MRFLRLIAVALIAWLGVAPVTAALTLPNAASTTYAYHASWHTVPPISAGTERGPPAEYEPDTIKGAADEWSYGTSARSGLGVSPTTYAYDHPTPLTWRP